MYNISTAIFTTAIQCKERRGEGAWGWEELSSPLGGTPAQRHETYPAPQPFPSSPRRVASRPPQRAGQQHGQRRQSSVNTHTRHKCIIHTRHSRNLHDKQSHQDARNRTLEPRQREYSTKASTRVSYLLIQQGLSRVCSALDATQTPAPLYSTTSM